MGLTAAWLLLVGTLLQSVLAVRDVLTDIGGGPSFVGLRNEYRRADDAHVQEFRAATSRVEVDQAEAEYDAAVKRNRGRWERAVAQAKRRATHWMIGWSVLTVGATVNLIAAYGL